MNSIWETVFCPQHGLLRFLDINTILPCLNHLLVDVTFGNYILNFPKKRKEIQ